MLDTLRECAELGVGDHEVIDVGPPQVLVHRASITRGSVLLVHNLADRPVTVRVPDIGAHAGQLDPARRNPLFGQPSREPPELVKPTA